MSALPEERQETALERAQRRRDEALARPIVIRCQDCLWEQEGPVLEARRAWAEHRRDEHDDPSGMESVERIAKPLTMREIKHGGRKRKHEPTRKEPDVQIRICKREDCDERALDHRGRYAGLCAEHKREAREQQAARQTGQPRGQLAAVPPPAPEPEKSAPVVAAPSREGDSGDNKGTSETGADLVSLAQRVTDLTDRRRAMLAELDALEVELRAAVADAQKALSACEIEDVA